MLSDMWWYYTVEKEPGQFYQGIYPDDMVLLPRRNLSKIDLRGKRALDICTMEGLMPTLMCKSGAAEVVATDSARPSAYPKEGNDSLYYMRKKITEVQRLHGVNWRYEIVPQMAPVGPHLLGLGERQFDLINLSGLLYHVYSPMHWLGAIRPTIKTGGLAIVSTNITFHDLPMMVFNEKGRLQSNLTTYWYISVSLFDYLLRYFRLMPVRAAYSRYEDGQTGYMSVICRAMDDAVPDEDDTWMRESTWHSWDSLWFGGHEMVGQSERSTIAFKDGAPDERVNLFQLTETTPETPFREATEHTAILRLGDTE